MSSALYQIRLMWLDGRGDFAARGIHVHLTTAPSILMILGIAEVQYEPALQCLWCREIHARPRDLSPDECARIRSWCDARAAAARALIEQQ